MMTDYATRIDAIDPDDLPPGTVLLGGQVTIERRIGRGGMSTVYAAVNHEGRTIALKIIASDVAKHPVVAERFRNEARLAQSLADFPRIVIPYAFGEIGELNHRLYITMPLVKGTPLSMAGDRHSWCRWTAAIADLARTVEGLHEHRVIHRDIKPGNIILSRHGTEDAPYLLDFGFAYSRGDGHIPATAGLTQAHECPGTKFYMAPEQALGASPAPSFDIYALALTLYELLAGVHPLEGMTPAEAVQRKCNRGLPSLSLRNHRPDLPPTLLDAVDRALQREPASRTATALELAQSLERALEEHEAKAPRVVTPIDSDPTAQRAEIEGVDLHDRSVEPIPPKTSRRAYITGLGLMVTLVLVGVGLWVVAHSASSGAPPAREPNRVSPPPIAPNTVAVPLPPVAPVKQRAATVERPPDAAVEISPMDHRPAQASPNKPPPKPPARKSALRSASASCEAIRQRAEQATTRKEWNVVLEATSHSECWAQNHARTQLRIQALHGLKQYKACIRAAKSIQAKRMAHLCERAQNDRPSSSR